MYSNLVFCKPLITPSASMGVLSAPTVKLQFNQCYYVRKIAIVSYVLKSRSYGHKVKFNNNILRLPLVPWVAAPLKAHQQIQQQLR